MDHHEGNQSPHAEMVPGMHVLTVGPDRENPAKQLVLPAVDSGAFRIQREPRAHHERYEQGETREHRNLRQRIVADVHLRFAFQKGVPADFMEHFLPELLAMHRNIKYLAGMMIADKGPEYPRQKEHGQNLPGGEMREADIAHAEMI